MHVDVCWCTMMTRWPTAGVDNELSDNVRQFHILPKQVFYACTRHKDTAERASTRYHWGLSIGVGVKHHFDFRIPNSSWGQKRHSSGVDSTIVLSLSTWIECYKIYKLYKIYKIYNIWSLEFLAHQWGCFWNQSAIFFVPSSIFIQRINGTSLLF